MRRDDPDATLSHPVPGRRHDERLSDDFRDQGLDRRPGERPGLLVKRGPNPGYRIELAAATITVGRASSCDLILDDVTVSRPHAALCRLENGEYAITDTGSLNGTYVNGSRVSDRVLADGDEIQIGRFKLVYVAARRTTDDTT